MVDIEAERPDFDWVSQVSRRIGTLVHRELDRLTRPRAGSQAPASLQASRSRLIAELAELGVPPDRCDEACDKVVRAIEHTLSDTRGRWLLGLDARVREAESELSLSGVIDGEIIDGVIDRTFVDRRGVRWIVDFKTSTHEGGGLEAFLDAEVARYRRQLTRYVRLMTLFKPGEPVQGCVVFPAAEAMAGSDGRLKRVVEPGGFLRRTQRAPVIHWRGSLAASGASEVGLSSSGANPGVSMSSN